MGVVGVSVPRVDGPAKVGGTARYVDDRHFPGMLYGRTIRTSIPRGRLGDVRLDFDRAGFTVVDWRDIPGRNCTMHITDDQPCLVQDEIRHVAEPVLLLAHEDRDALWSARVQLTEERDEPELDPQTASREHAHVVIADGDVERALQLADLVIEGEYRTGAQEHLYIEPNGVIAVPEAHGGITIYGSLQCPYYVHHALSTLLGLPAERVRVVAAENGGGFGGKEDYPSVIAGHAALLALKAQRPVKLVYDRAEDMLATTKRHPSIVRHRTGVMKNGRLTAMVIDVLLDGGAYVTLSPVVLSRACLHAQGAYRCPNVRINGRAVMTNTPPNGAFRGFGAPQTQFAMEVHMDRIAEALRIDPAKLRLRNVLRAGDRTATGQVLADSTAELVLREAIKRAGWRRKRAAWKGTNRGIGLALFRHGAGFTGSGEVQLASRCTLTTTALGVRIRVANTEIGQGTCTVLAQIVADALGVSMDEVTFSVPDTADVPNSGPTVASRTVMVVGGILERAARALRQQLGARSPAEHFAQHGETSVTQQYEAPPGLHWDDKTYRGDAYGTYSWGCDVAEVTYDPVTYIVRATKLTAVHEFGRSINPALARGQMEGGSAQGVGWALIEEVVMKDGAMANAQLTNYTIPTTLDTPRFDATIIENPYPHGAFGAKGVGELPMNGPGPAIVNALRHIGLDLRQVPATPERVMEAVHGRA